MAKSKNSNKKHSVKVNDLGAKKDPKGGNVQLHDLTITKQIDKSTPILSTAASIKEKW